MSYPYPHVHWTSCLTSHIMMYFIVCIYPCGYFILVCCAKTIFSLRVKWTHLRTIQFFSSSTSLFDNINVKKLKSVSKYILETFTMNNNPSNTKWNKSPLFLFSCYVSSLTSDGNKTGVLTSSPKTVIHSLSISTMSIWIIMFYFLMFIHIMVCLFPPTTIKYPKKLFIPFVMFKIIAGYLCDNLFSFT